MEAIGKSPLLRVSEKEIQSIREAVKLGDQDAITRDVDMVLAWFEKQQHLPRIKLDRHVVELMLLSRKGSVEQTKQKVDQLYTLRTLVPELLAPRDVLHPRIQKQFKAVQFAILPKLNHDLSRVSVFKFTEDVDSFELDDWVKYMFMTIEYSMKYDYSAGQRLICDYQHASLGHLTKLNPITIKRAELYLQKAYSSRVFGIHYINAPSFIGTVVRLIKGALSDKLGSRLQVHTSHEDLHMHISQACLPKDYGGDDGTLEFHADNWINELSKDQNRQYLKEQESLRSNEELRIGDKITDDVLGLPGSFKTINVD